MNLPWCLWGHKEHTHTYRGGEGGACKREIITGFRWQVDALRYGGGEGERLKIAHLNFFSLESSLFICKCYFRNILFGVIGTKLSHS